MSGFGVRAIETDVVLFPVGEKSKEKVIKTEETVSETVTVKHENNKLKLRFARLRKSIKKRGLGIL